MKRFALLAAALLLAGAAVAQDEIIRVCSYNLLNYPGSTGPQRDPEFSLVLEEIEPDLIIAQEVTSDGSADLFIENVLDPAVWSRTPSTGIGQSDEYLIYKSAEFEILSVTSITTVLRNIELYEVARLTLPGQPVLWIANAHLKASQGTENEQQRLAEVNEFIDYMNDENLHGEELLFCGDLNLYGSDEPAYQALLGGGGFLDPIDSPGNWHNNASFAAIHTQSPRTEQFGGGATGGMDDRFDFLLAQGSLFDDDGWDLLEETYTAFGNDGNHFNDAINDGFNSVVSAEVADAIHNASDHLPVYVDVGYWSGAPVVFDLVPAVPSPTIGPGGGVLEYTAMIANTTQQSLQGQGWTEVTLPNGNVVSPVQLVNLILPAQQTINSAQTLYVPGYAPGGSYTFTAKLGYYPGFVGISDSFPFSKIGGGTVDGDFERYLRALPAPAVDGTGAVPAAGEQADLPSEFEFAGVYPNPFNSRTSLEILLNSRERVEVEVFDVLGRNVATLQPGALNPGHHRIDLNLDGHAGGMYFVRASAGGITHTAKALLVR